MSDQNIDQVVDNLEQPGNEDALNDALREGLGEGNDTPPADDAAADQKPGNDNPQDNPNGKPADPPEDDPDKGKSNRYQDILRDRNEARQAAADKDVQVNTLQKTIDEQAAEIERLKRGNGDGEGGTNVPADKLPEGKSLQDLIDEGVNKALGKRDQSAAAEKSDAQEIADLIQKVPDAANMQDQVKEMMAKHPTLSALAAYASLKGIEAMGDAPPSNSSKTTTGNRPKPGLRDQKKPSQMSDDELEAEVKKTFGPGGPGYGKI